MLTEIGSIGESHRVWGPGPVWDPRAQSGTPEPGWWAVTRVANNGENKLWKLELSALLAAHFRAELIGKHATFSREPSPPPGATRGVAPGLTR